MTAWSVRGIAALALAIFLAPASAGVIIGGTRVVYPAKEREVTVKLENKSKEPALVQAWLDKGDADSTPDSVEVPFMMTPPVFRMEPGKGQVLRLAYTQEPLPTDKETLFWLNVLEVPPKPQDADSPNHLQFAFRHRVKVYFRPQGLPYHVAEAPRKLEWKLAVTGDGYALEVSNTTPYHVSLASLNLVESAGSHKGRASDGSGSGTVAPGDVARFALPSLTSPPAKAEVEYSAINDYGGRVAFKAPVTMGEVL